VIVCPAGEQIAVEILCRGAPTIRPAIECVIKMMSFKEIFKHFFQYPSGVLRH